MILPPELKKLGFSLNPNGKSYYALKNKGGDLWLVSQGSRKDIRKALQIFHTDTLKGTALKRLFPYLSGLLTRTNKGYARTLFLRNGTNWDLWLRKTFGPGSVIDSFFFRFPYKKLNLQISQKNGPILGYVKVPCDPQARSLMLNEKRTLTRLKHLGFKGIPNILSDKLPASKGLNLLATDAKRDWNFHRARVFGKTHLEFLTRLARRTSIRKRLRETGFWAFLSRGSRNFSKKFPGTASLRLSQAVKKIGEAYGDRKSLFSLCHRDFNFTNIVEEKVSLYVFDWERSSWEYPPFLDLFNFHLYGCQWLEKMEPAKILLKCRGLAHSIDKRFLGSSPDTLLLSYLADTFLRQVFSMEENPLTSPRLHKMTDILGRMLDPGKKI